MQRAELQIEHAGLAPGNQTMTAVAPLAAPSTGRDASAASDLCGLDHTLPSF